MATPADCLFCKIIERKIAAKIVFENDTVLGFKDVNPQAPVHVLFAPKKHIADISELKAEDMAFLTELVAAANAAAREFKVDASGFRLVFNAKTDGGQTINHLHLHLLGGRRMHWPPG